MNWINLYHFSKCSSWAFPQEGNLQLVIVQDQHGEPDHFQDQSLRTQSLCLVASFVSWSCLSELWCHAALLCPSSVIFPESSWGSRIFDGPQRSGEQGMCYITFLQTNVTLINTILLFVHWMHIEIYNYMELMLIVQPLRCPKVPELWFKSADRGEL